MEAWLFIAFFHLDVDTLGLYSSEGIQLGNIGSAAGIIGAWTGATHDHGLCSPLITLSYNWLIDLSLFIGDPVGENFMDFHQTLMYECL